MAAVSLRLRPLALLASAVLLISLTAASAQGASIVAKPTTSAPAYYVLRKAKDHCRANYTRTKVTIRVKHGRHVVKRKQIRCVAKTTHTPSSASTTSPATFPPDLPTATVTVTVIPSAASHTYATQAGVPLSVGAPGVLQGATGTGLSAVLVSGPAHGSLTLHHDGGFSYTPPAGASGIEQFVYRVSSSDGESSNTATVTLKVTPVAAGGLYDVAANGALQVPAGGLLASDVGSGLTAHLVSPTIDGSLTVAANGSATYTPDGGFSGADSFTYDVVDASGQTSNTATVTINVGAQPPNVVSETFNGAIGNTELQVEGVESASPAVYLTGTNALAGDSDPNGGSLSTVPAQITTAQGGSVTMGSEGNFSYEPPAGFRGPSDSFTYTVSESEGLTATATATIDFAGGMVWYVNNAASGTGNGTSAAPLHSAADVTQAQSGDTIFLFAGSGDYTGGITLPGGVSLVGAGATLSVDGTTLLAQSGPTPVVTNAGGAGITVGEGDAIAGVDVENTAGDGIAASGVDGFTVASSVLVKDAGGDGLDVTGGDGTINFGATITDPVGHSVAIEGRTGSSAVQLSGPITDTGDGILLDDNAGTTAFSAQITASTGTHTAFAATDAGTVSATGSSNTLTTTSGEGLELTGTTIGTAGISFSSVTASGPAYGIDVVGTGSSSQGSLNIGNGVDGGTIQGAGYGIWASGLPVVNIEHTTIENSTDDAIHLSDVGSPSITYETISGSGGDGIDVVADTSTGTQTATIDDNDLTDQTGTAIALDLAGGGNVVVDTNTIGDATAGSGSSSGDGLDLFAADGTLEAEVGANTIEGITAGNALDAQSQAAGADLELTLDNNPLLASGSAQSAVSFTNDGGTACLNPSGNSIEAASAGDEAVEVDQADATGTFTLEGYGGGSGPTDTAGVENFLAQEIPTVADVPVGTALAALDVSNPTGFVSGTCLGGTTILD